MDSYITEQFTLLGIALAVIFSRTCWRLRAVGIKGFQVDDYLMMVAACVYSCETYLAYSVGEKWHWLANNGMTDEERRLLKPSSEEYRLRINGSKTQVAGWNTYTFLLWTLKSAMCTYYIRLMKMNNCRLRPHPVNLDRCPPLHSPRLPAPQEELADLPGSRQYPAISRTNVFVVFALNVATDIYLLTIPIPVLWKSSIKRLKKAALIVVFSGGTFVTIAGTLRAVLIVVNPVTGAQQAGSWAIRETFVAVITTNVPILFPIFRIWLTLVIHSVRKSVDKSAAAGPGFGDVELENGKRKWSHGPRSINPLPSSSGNESEERLNRQQRISYAENPTSLGGVYVTPSRSTDGVD
ncbi:hypothetical protein PG985_011444 [Apiospora marii]|uniref:uncharacterized protein n=1 Tax=Apiospora marii TaxID=335849 RepID=UPI003130594F